MAALDEDVFRSRQFLFVVGENQAEFSVHAAIIAKQSKALDALINGPMKEASNGKAIFEDIQEDTFIRFCQFAYTGNYTTPDFTELVIETTATAPDEPTEGSELAIVSGHRRISTNRAKREKAKNIGWREKLREDQISNNIESGRTIFTGRCEVRQNSNSLEDYTPVFLGHAELCIFAEKWGISKLKSLALSKLHGTLTTFTLYEDRRSDIVELLRYSLSNDHTPSVIGSMEELRSTVMKYTARQVGSLVKCPGFISLLEKGGQLAPTLVQMLVQPTG